MSGRKNTAEKKATVTTNATIPANHDFTAVAEPADIPTLDSGSVRKAESWFGGMIVGSTVCGRIMIDDLAGKKRLNRERSAGIADR